MKVIDYIKQSKSPFFSFEILPPLKGKSIQTLFDGIDPLMEFNPPFINVTYHREEYIYKKREKGYLEKVAIRKRPGTVGICAALMNRYDAYAVPHLICGGFTTEETENALIDLSFLGINNILALRGDPIKTEINFIPETNGHTYAVDLVKQIVSMNKSHYIDDEIQDATPTDFCIGVAGYPEKHFEALNLKTDLKYLKQKIDAGAEYIVTQMFYDNQKFYDFVKLCKEHKINVPIIPGLKPITSLKQIAYIPKTFHVDIPETLANELEKCKTDDDIKKVGIEWGIQQSKELIKFGTTYIHYYSMGKSGSVKQIASEVF